MLKYRRAVLVGILGSSDEGSWCVEVLFIEMNSSELLAVSETKIH